MNLGLPSSNTHALLGQWVPFCEQSSLSDSGHPGPPSTFHLPRRLVLKKLSLYISRNRRHIVKTKPTPNHTFPATKGKKQNPTNQKREQPASFFYPQKERARMCPGSLPWRKALLSPHHLLSHPPRPPPGRALAPGAASPGKGAREVAGRAALADVFLPLLTSVWSHDASLWKVEG